MEVGLADFSTEHLNTWRCPYISKADGVTTGRLLFQERELGSKEAMLRDIAVPAEIDFSDFMEDILGDG